MYLWVLQVDLCLPVHVSHPYELQLKTQIKSCILNCKKPLLSIITGRKRYTWGGVLFFESNESVVVTQLTSLLKLTTVHEHLDGFYNRVKVGMLFTLSSIRKTLIICPAKQKPSTNLPCIAWGILTKKGVDLAFASVRTWSEDPFPYFILLMNLPSLHVLITVTLTARSGLILKNSGRMHECWKIGIVAGVIVEWDLKFKTNLL